MAEYDIAEAGGRLTISGTECQWGRGVPGGGYGDVEVCRCEGKIKECENEKELLIVCLDY